MPEEVLAVTRKLMDDPVLVKDEEMTLVGIKQVFSVAKANIKSTVFPTTLSIFLCTKVNQSYFYYMIVLLL